jgi:hypothetical protein
MMDVQCGYPMIARRRHVQQRIEQDDGIAAAGQRDGNRRTRRNMGIQPALYGGAEGVDRSGMRGTRHRRPRGSQPAGISLYLPYARMRSSRCSSSVSSGSSCKCRSPSVSAFFSVTIIAA